MNKLQELPPRRADLTPEVADIHQAALLIDFDNVTMGIRSNLGQELHNLLNSDVIRGKVAVQRAYADWRRYPQYIVPLSEASIDLIFAPAYGSSKKNATDIRLAIDALELVFVRPEIRTFILMSGDSDFSSLVLKLKEYGKYVIGVGIQESSSDLLVQNCDEYYSYSALSGLSREGDQPVERHDPWVLTEKAIEKMVQRGDTMRSDRLKQVMLEIDPSFNEKEHGFSKFNRFVVEAASRGLVSIQKMENGQYGVAPAGKSAKASKAEKSKTERRGRPDRAPRGEKQKDDRKSQGRRDGGRRSRERGRERADEGEDDRGETSRARPKLTMKSALELLNEALEQLLEDKSGEVRDSDVKRRLLELHPNFDEGELGYNKFSKFLQAAEERKAVRLTRGPNNNFHVGWPGKRRETKPERQQAEKAAPVPEEPRETTVKRLARFLFGGHKEEPETQDKKVETTASAAQAVDEKPAEKPAASRSERQERRSERDRGRRGQQRGPRGERGSAPADDRGRQSTGERSKAGDRRQRRDRATDRGGRERGKARQSAAEGEREHARDSAPRPAPGPSPEERPAAAAVEERQPVQTSTATPEAEREERSAAEPKVSRHDEKEEPAVAPAPMPGSPRGTIRGRWGSRGRYRPAATPPPIFEGQRKPRSSGVREPEAAGDEEVRTDVAHAHIIEHLKTHYPGVGEKTAETLVETFGANLFRIMDEQPDRIRAVLPDHRADRVLEGRRKELEAESG